MPAEDEHAASARLLECLAERADGVSQRRRAELDREIDQLASTLGLDAEEVASLEPAAARPQRTTSGMVGRFRVHRLARDILPFWIGLIVGGAVVGLAGPIPGGTVIAAVVVLWIVRAKTRVAVFDVDEAGSIELRNWGRLEWPDVEEVSYHVRPPLFSGGDRLGRASTAVVRIKARGRRTLRLAQGMLFQTKPTRRVVTYDKLSKLLKDGARAAGLKIERTEKGKAGWRAHR